MGLWGTTMTQLKRQINDFYFERKLLLILSDTLVERPGNEIDPVESCSDATVDVGVLRFVQLLGLWKLLLVKLFHGGSGGSEEVDCILLRGVGDSNRTGRYSLRPS